jgi:hypothetical protein
VIRCRQIGNAREMDIEHCDQRGQRFCAADAFDICNGNRIDDRKPCSGAGCPIVRYCGRVALWNQRPA